MRAEIRQEVELVSPFDESEHAANMDALSWIDSGIEICRIEKPDIPPKHLISYSVMVDGEYILLVDPYQR